MHVFEKQFYEIGMTGLTKAEPTDGYSLLMSCVQTVDSRLSQLVWRNSCI